MRDPVVSLACLREISAARRAHDESCSRRPALRDERFPPDTAERWQAKPPLHVGCTRRRTRGRWAMGALFSAWSRPSWAATASRTGPGPAPRRCPVMAQMEVFITAMSGQTIGVQLAPSDSVGLVKVMYLAWFDIDPSARLRLILGTQELEDDKANPTKLGENWGKDKKDEEKDGETDKDEDGDKNNDEDENMDSQIVQGNFENCCICIYRHGSHSAIHSCKLRPHDIGNVKKIELRSGHQTAQDRPKTPPRRSWSATFLVLENVVDFGPFWARFWVPLGAPCGPPWGPLGVPFRIPKRTYLQDALGWPLGALLEPSWGPPGALLGPSWGSLGALLGPQEGKKSAQEDSRERFHA